MSNLHYHHNLRAPGKNWCIQEIIGREFLEGLVGEWGDKHHHTFADNELKILQQGSRKQQENAPGST